MTDHYTPTDEDIRNAYVEDYAWSEDGETVDTDGLVADPLRAEEYDRWLARRDVRTSVKSLQDAADAMDAEYEERTVKSGAYGQLKIRAALKLGAGLIRDRASRLQAELEGSDK